MKKHFLIKRKQLNSFEIIKNNSNNEKIILKLLIFYSIIYINNILYLN